VQKNLSALRVHHPYKKTDFLPYKKQITTICPQQFPVRDLLTTAMIALKKK
jgi:hypothetical protein